MHQRRSTGCSSTPNDHQRSAQTRLSLKPMLNLNDDRRAEALSRGQSTYLTFKQPDQRTVDGREHNASPVSTMKRTHGGPWDGITRTADLDSFAPRTELCISLASANIARRMQADMPAIALRRGTMLALLHEFRNSLDHGNQVLSRSTTDYRCRTAIDDLAVDDSGPRQAARSRSSGHNSNCGIRSRTLLGARLCGL